MSCELPRPRLTLQRARPIASENAYKTSGKCKCSKVRKMSSRDLPRLFTDYWDPPASIEWKSAKRLSCVRYRTDAAYTVLYGLLAPARASRHEKAMIFGDGVPVKGGDRVVGTLGAGGRTVDQDSKVGDGRSRPSPPSTHRLEWTEERQ
jgi:hypothetical protein